MSTNTTVTVMVTEDEPIILNNIVKKVENSSDSVSVIGKAQSGNETLALLARAQPDILITDIEMPGVNGLELIRQVREHYPDIHIVILSGYSNFEYARTAIKHNVEDYLLKPVSQGDLKELLNRLSHKIRQEKHAKERNILSMTLKGDEENASWPYYFHEGQFFLALISLGSKPSQFTSSQINRDYQTLWEDFDIPGFLKSRQQLEHAWLIDESYSLQKFVIIYSKNDTFTTEHFALTLYRHMASAAADVPFHIDACKGLIPCSEIWNTAKRIRHFYDKTIPAFTRGYCCISDSLPDTSSAQNLQKNLRAYLHQINNPTQLLKYAKDGIYEYHSLHAPAAYTDALLYEIYNALPTLFQVEENICLNYMSQILSRFYAYKGPEELCQEVSASLTEIICHYAPEMNADSLYEKLKKYIEDHFNCKISLNDLSERFGYTSSYINRIYKKNSSISPLQYMTNLRMEHAKQLLKKDIAADIKSIAAAAGYEDAPYFSRVFKNETGKTPSAFAGRQL